MYKVIDVLCFKSSHSVGLDTVEKTRRQREYTNKCKWLLSCSDGPKETVKTGEETYYPTNVHDRTIVYPK